MIEPHENLSIIDIMAHSSNIDQISDSFSKNDLYKLIKYFGFGTNIALNNESKVKLEILTIGQKHQDLYRARTISNKLTTFLLILLWQMVE